MVKPLPSGATPRCAEVLVSGKTWLAPIAYPEAGGARLVQTAIFAPKGRSGFP